MSTEKDRKTTLVPIFDGKEENFQTWWVRFRACGKLSGFPKALGETPEPGLPSDQEEVESLSGTDITTKMNKAAADINDLAIASLTLTFETNELTSMTLTAQSDEWPKGLASEVIKQLKENTSQRTL